MKEPDHANSNPEFSIWHHVLLGGSSVAGQKVVDAESIAQTRN
jgi:hypothetical protein